ncbi:MAG: branched-chain-amino-acid transaminase [Brevinematales bacterium]|nr:branched-chain-amino-acid transaminase [Brevinematales bacterium]
MGKMVYLNGRLVEAENAMVSVFDHGLLYGDGVFEGIRAYNKRIFKLDEHIDRLYNSAKIIMLNIPISKEEFKKAIIETCKANKIVDGYIRPVVTRGAGTLGLSPWLCPNPNYFIIADTIQLYPKEMYENGLEVVTVATRRNLTEAVNPMIKSLNYLNNILAKIEGKIAGVEEVIMLNQEGYVAECSGDNIFIVKNNKIYTPPIVVGALPGITQATVNELAEKEGYQVIEKIFSRAEMYIADEVFLTGTAAEIVPVVKVDGRVIGDGKPGKITKVLMDKFKKYVVETGTPIE